MEIKTVKVIKDRVLPKVLIECVTCECKTVHCITKSKDLYMCACGTEINIRYVEENA